MINENDRSLSIILLVIDPDIFLFNLTRIELDSNMIHHKKNLYQI